MRLLLLLQPPGHRLVAFARVRRRCAVGVVASEGAAALF
jgi:hypothetical protein